MAAQQQKKGGGGKKIGRNKAKCANYKAMRHAHNKDRRIIRHFSAVEDKLTKLGKKLSEKGYKAMKKDAGTRKYLLAVIDALR